MFVQAQNDTASPDVREAPAHAAWNAVRCPENAAGGHVESYFLKLNDPSGNLALWIKATILVREGGTPRVAEAWAIAFTRDGRHVAVKETSPLARATFGSR